MVVLTHLAAPLWVRSAKVLPMHPSDPILLINQLHFAYPGAPPLVANWSATIGAGVTMLQGESGSGKSTLLRLLAGQLPPTRGRLVLGGVDARTDPDGYRRQLFVCDPPADADSTPTARACTAAWSADDGGFRSADWQALVTGFALNEHLDKPLYMLSTGSRRKLWLAYALASGRRLLLLDEPLAGLDAPAIRFLWATLAQQAGRWPQALLLAHWEAAPGVPLSGRICLPLANAP